MPTMTVISRSPIKILFTLFPKLRWRVRQQCLAVCRDDGMMLIAFTHARVPKRRRLPERIDSFRVSSESRKIVKKHRFFFLIISFCYCLPNAADGGERGKKSKIKTI